MTREKWKQMTAEEQRIKIAELCGWSNVHKTGEQFDSEPLMDKGIGLVGFRNLTVTKERQLEVVPDYLNDLNACHEFEKTLVDEHEGTKWTYKQRLKTMLGASWGFATAEQRCEALVLTMTGEK